MKNKKILVIEDNTDVRENICEILELDGYDVVSAENGKIGVRQAATEVPDLILCDVMMPELDGFGVLKILSNNPKTKNIPFIFLTAKSERQDFRKGMGLGADDYIVKPFDDTELLEAITIRLNKRAQLKSDAPIQDSKIQMLFSDERAEEELRKLSKDREIRAFADKEVIVHEGGIARWMYFVVSGSVKKVHTNEFGKELISRIYRPGEYFGYLALLTEEGHRESLISVGDSTVRLIPSDDFKKLLFSNSDFTSRFVKELAHVTSNLEMSLIEMAYSSVRRKVALAILSFVGDATEDEIVLKVSRDNLAASAGTAKETLIRTLSDFKEEGLVDIKGRSIVVLDKAGLESMPQ